MKNETIEEAAETHLNSGIIPNDYTSFIAGAAWQAERMYSEEDMKEFARFFHVCYESGMDCLAPKDWKEQFNKQKS